MDDAPPDAKQLDLSAVPLFPLPNVVLFPRAVLPLHIFEERYKTMTAEALAGDGVIAMALLKGGWEKCYYGAPPIEPVVCAGKILTHEKLPDGKYNFLLQGIARGRVVSEDRSRPYRVGQLELLAEADVMEIDLENERHRLACMLGEGCCANLPVVKQFRQMLQSTMPTAEVADLLAFNFIEDVQVKQSLLAETDPRARVERLITVLQHELRPAAREVPRTKSQVPNKNQRTNEEAPNGIRRLELSRLGSLPIVWYLALGSWYFPPSGPAFCNSP